MDSSFFLKLPFLQWCGPDLSWIRPDHQVMLVGDHDFMIMLETDADL